MKTLCMVAIQCLLFERALIRFDLVMREAKEADRS